MEVIKEEENDLIITNCLIVFPLYGKMENINVAKYGLDIFNITSEKFEAINDEQLKRSVSALKTILLLEEVFQECCYVITEEGEIKNLWKFYYFLRTIKPSKLVNPICHFEVHSQMVDGKKTKFGIGPMSIWDDIRLHEVIEQPLIVAEYDTFHYLMDNYLKKENDKDFQKLERIYFAATNNTDPYLKFLILMMLIESLVTDNENTGIIYKICRTCAILLGNYEAASATIFDNMKILYNDRSKFVHSADPENISDEKIDYLHHLVCSIMTTFMLGDIKLKTLFKNTNKYGYGQRSNLLSEYGVKDDLDFIANSAKLITTVKK